VTIPEISMTMLYVEYTESSETAERDTIPIEAMILTILNHMIVVLAIDLVGS
jgi:hypothetical protein